MSTQPLPIVFGSLNEGADPKSLPPGTMLRAENCAMDKARRLVKRDGTIGLDKTTLAGGTIASGVRLQTRGLDTAVQDATTLYGYDAALDAWATVGRPPTLTVTQDWLADAALGVTVLDIATSGSLLVKMLRIFGGSIHYSVTNLNTGAVVVPLTVLTTKDTRGFRLLINAGVAYFVYGYTDSGTGYIDCASLNLSTFVLTAGVHLASDAVVTGPPHLDAVIGTSLSGTTLYVAFAVEAVGSIAFRSFVLSTLAPVGTLLWPAADMVSVALCYGTASGYVTAVYSLLASTITRVVTLNVNTLALEFGPTTVYAGFSNSVFVVEHSATHVLIGYQHADLGYERLDTALYTVTTHVPVAVSERSTSGLTSPMRPWSMSGRWFTACVLYIHSTVTTVPIPQASCVIIEIEVSETISGVGGSQHLHRATLENQTGWQNNLVHVTNAAVAPDGAILVPAARRLLEPENTGTTVPLGWDLFTVTTSTAQQSATIGKGALIAAAAPYWWDGATVFPYGFAIAPQIISATATAGGAMVAGIYSYVAVYVWRDAAGLLHRSMPSPPFSGTTSGSDLSLTVVITSSALSGKQTILFGTSEPNRVYVELYRTTIGGTGPHYLLSHAPLYQVLANDPQTSGMSIVDTKADADIGNGRDLNAQAQLYTDLGELDNVPPPALLTVVTHRGRLAGIGPDRRTVWLSKDSTLDATLAPGFNEALTLAFASDKNALASLDEKLVVFGESTIDVVHGDGPADDGGSNTWQIQGVQVDVGCINPSSVVTSPMGVMFQSTRGIETFTRDLSVEWTGEAVVDTLATYPAITSAVLCADASEIRFTCDDGESGIVLAWNYHQKTWFTRVYADAATVAGSTSVRFVDAALIDGVYTMLTAGGQVYQETADHHLDDGTGWVERDIILAPISPGGSLAWHRVKDLSLLGTSVTDHNLEVSFARDYATTYEQVKVYQAGSAVTAVGPLEKARITLKVQKRQAVQIRIRDLEPTSGTPTAGAGPIFEALMLRVGVKPGPAKTSAGQQG